MPLLFRRLPLLSEPFLLVRIDLDLPPHGIGDDRRAMRQRSTQTPPAAGLSCRSGTGFAGHRPVTAGWRRPPPGHRQPAPVTASWRRSPPANAREAPSCLPNPGFAIYLANFMRQIASFMRKIM